MCWIEKERRIETESLVGLRRCEVDGVKATVRTAGCCGAGVRYLVLADDLTGALDTGLQLRRQGIPTKVLAEYPAGNYFQNERIPALVINTNSRHSCPETAYRIVREICREAARYPIEILYKKTDSALRGNISAELEAIADAGYETIYFAPAYPKLYRITRGGEQLIHQTPVDQSPFGQDMLNPIKTASVPKLLAENWLPSAVIRQETELDSLQGQKGIVIFDAENDRRLGEIAGWIARQPGKFALAGCAGFAEHLQPIFRYSPREKEPEIMTYEGVIVISGSLNPLSFVQIQAAVKSGFGVISVEGFEGFLDRDDFAVTKGIVRQVLNAYAKNPKLVIKTADCAGCGSVKENLRVGQRVADHFGELVRALRQNGFSGIFVVSGGDTLGSIVRYVGGHSIEPLREIEPGVVLANILTDTGICQFITKSGGIGSAEVYCLIENMFINR